MRITRRSAIPGLPAVDDSAAVATPPAPQQPQRQTTEASAGDRVDLSDGARLRQRLRADVGDVESPDSGRVASLRARVAAGTYQPAPNAVAKSLVGDLVADLVV